MAKDVALKLIEDFDAEGAVNFIKGRPRRPRKDGKSVGIVPRGIDREIAECLGTDYNGNGLMPTPY